MNTKHIIIALTVLAGTTTWGSDPKLARSEKAADLFLKQHNGNAQEALIDAAKNNYSWAIDYLIQHGAGVNAASQGGWTALIIAAGEGHDKVVAQLIAAKANVNAQNDIGNTALMLAAAGGYDKVVAQLMAARADIKTMNKNDDMALSFAIQKRHEAIAKLLIEAGADVFDLTDWEKEQLEKLKIVKY